MITISQPYIIRTIDSVELRCRITGRYLPNEEIEIYFRTSEEWGDYFVSEACDSFLLAVLLPALKHHEDILITCPVSERLLYNSRTSLIYMLSEAFKFNPIKITTTSSTVQTNYESTAVGCGCSLGVDSLAAIFSNSNLPDTPHYAITHLTYFNVGSHGYKDEAANRKSYLRDMKKVDEFATMLGLPVVKIESNVWKLFSGFDFDRSGNIINMSTVLSLQKLFGRYLYGSNFQMKDVSLTDRCLGYFETLMLPMSSTESTQLIVANPDLSRPDKMELILKNSYTYKYLYVCWKELIVNNDPNHPIAKIKDNYLNCTRCDKCLRTCAQLDILGVIDKFTGIFDIDYYKKIKNQYWGRILANRHNNSYYADTIRLATKYGYKIPLTAKVNALNQRLHLSRVIHLIKSFLKK